MKITDVSDVRALAGLVSSIISAADKDYGDGNRKLKARELRAAKEDSADYAKKTMRAAEAIRRLAVKRYRTSEPTIPQIEKCITMARREVEKAGHKSSDQLSALQLQLLAPTWRKFAEAADEYTENLVGASEQDVLFQS